MWPFCQKLPQEAAPWSGYHGNIGVEERWGVREEQEESKEVHMCLFVLGLMGSLSSFSTAK